MRCAPRALLARRASRALITRRAARALITRRAARALITRRAARALITRRAARALSWALLLAALIPATASAGPAEELSGLFLQACLSYAGRPAALRQWAASKTLPVVPDPARAAFLGGAPGQVFDASNNAGKFALLSSDDGICGVVTDRAGDLDVARALQQALSDAGVKYRLVNEQDDKLNPKLHHREYLAARPPRAWRLLSSTVHDFGQAMLTAAPE
jgi:hypothetical protein